MADDNKLNPIINRKRTSTLKSKKVDIAGVGDFGRDSTETNSQISTTSERNKTTPNETANSITNVSQNSSRKEELNFDMRKKATKTQKMSPDVILKLNTLKPYIKDLEEMNTDGSPSINDIVNMLLDNYVNTKLSTRQLQGYKAVYQNLYEHL
ncbi:TPA_asm: hypothetical protein GIH59_12595 [Listeria monocytogenes]|nr:hypothetical protein [Listeria monocytogenes]